MAIPQRGGLPHSDIHGSTPARGSPWLFAACHVLHRLLVPRHPPNALLSLETTPPDIDPGVSTMHRNHPQRPCGQWQRSLDHHRQHRPPPRRSRTTDHSRSAHNSRHLNVRPARWRPPSRRSNTSGQTREQARPETHQNLIHPDKDHTSRQRAADANGIANSILSMPRRRTDSMPISFASPRYTLTNADQLATPIARPGHRGGGDRTRTDDPLLAKQVLSQLSYAPATSQDLARSRALANDGALGGPGRI